MRLADFIRTKIEPILQKWQEFALTIFPARYMDKSELRDHAKAMLLTIAADLEQPQNKREQEAKSKGLESESTQQSAADEHGVDRLASGFSVIETISEFRALRASVIDLWTEATGTLTEREIEDLMRFNEAIDQALTESLSSYAVEKELHTRLFGTILLASPDPIYVLDLDGRFIYANKATQELFALPQETLIGKNAFDLALPFAADLQQRLQHVIDTRKTDRGELSHVFAAGQGERFEYLLTPLLDEHDNIEAIVGISRDITERKIAEEKIWHNANYDLLTGLPNRRLFLDRLNQEIKHASRSGLPLAVLFIDLDGFKEVNDSLGHEVGDRLLCCVAKRLNTCVRKADTVARLGGDEFTVVLTSLHGSKDVGAVAQKIVDALARPFNVVANVVQISASIGITLCPQNSATPEGLLRNADQAMYAAKKSGRNQVCFFEPTSSQ